MVFGKEGRGSGGELHLLVKLIHIDCSSSELYLPILYIGRKTEQKGKTMSAPIKYKVTTITDDGKITTKTEHGPEDWSHDLIALQLLTKHSSLAHQPFMTICELVAEQSAHMGYQVAFVDENMTIVVTEMRG